MAATNAKASKLDRRQSLESVPAPEYGLNHAKEMVALDVFGDDSQKELLAAVHTAFGVKHVEAGALADFAQNIIAATGLNDEAEAIKLFHEDIAPSKELVQRLKGFAKKGFTAWDPVEEQAIKVGMVRFEALAPPKNQLKRVNVADLKGKLQEAQKQLAAGPVRRGKVEAALEDFVFKADNAADQERLKAEHKNFIFKETNERTNCVALAASLILYYQDHEQKKAQSAFEIVAADLAQARQPYEKKCAQREKAGWSGCAKADGPSDTERAAWLLGLPTIGKISDKKVQQASVLDLQKWLEEPQFAGHDDVTSKAALAKFADHHFGHVTMPYMRKLQFVAKIQKMFSPGGVEDPRLFKIGYTESQFLADELWPWAQEDDV